MKSLIKIIVITLFIIDTQLKADFPICTSGECAIPAISGNLVIWADHRTEDWFLYGKYLPNGNEFLIRERAITTDRRHPKVSGNRIAFMADPGSAKIKDLSTGIESYVSDDGSQEEYPDISGDIVVWADFRNGNMDIYGKNLSTNIEFRICVRSGNQTGPAIDGNIVVWISQDNPDSIYGKNLITGIEFPVCTNTAAYSLIDISGNVVVWKDWRNYSKIGGDIYGKNLLTGVEFPICTASRNQEYPAIGGNIVVWDDFRNKHDIYGINLVTMQEFLVCTNASYYPAVDGNTIAWVDCRNGGSDIYGVYVDTPTCSAPIPGDVNGDCRFNLLDFTILSQHWLECNLVPEDACWD